MFNNSSFIDKLRSLDVYRKLPTDYLQPTCSGAIFSICASILMMVLFVSETKLFMEIKTSSEMQIDVNKGGEKLTINIDFVLEKIPCSIVSLDVQDVLGSHQENYSGNIVKLSLDKNGNTIKMKEIEDLKKLQTSTDKSKHSDMPDFSKVKEQFKNEEGCNIYGTLSVNKVPGNFHFSSHHFAPILGKLISEQGEDFKFDLTHKVKHLSFGDEKDFEKIHSVFKHTENTLTPLDGESKKINTNDSKKIYEYYLKVVPTTYVDINNNEYHVHQFTTNDNEYKSQFMLPAIFFRYDLSAITVKHAQYKEGKFHYFIEICAIIGGVFTVVGIIDSLVNKFFMVVMGLFGVNLAEEPKA